MVNTAHRFKTQMILAGFAVALPCWQASAQSSAAFSTVPYTQNKAPSTAIQRPAQVSATAPAHRGPKPVTMFRAIPSPVAQQRTAIDLIAPSQGEAVPAAVIEPRASRPYSIVNQAQIDAAQTGWNPANTDAVVAPPMVAGMVASQPVGSRSPTNQARRYQARQSLYRGPFRRILQDTRRGITRDLPEALADALPWVDGDAKNEPFDEVLDRVSDELRRAAQSDPAWALPAQREIRDLSQRLSSLPAPPPLGQEVDDMSALDGLSSVDNRPFRPRPIWPGASGRPEAQVRPVTLITSSVEQDGPRVSGVIARYTPAVEDDDGNPRPQAGRHSRQRANDAPRRPKKSP
jgi:hypothetical protein